MHVVSCSRRSDIPAFYSPWLMNRIEAGYCRVPNPFSKQPYEVSLRPDDVLAMVFWTKNPRPLLPHLDHLDDKGLSYYFQFTITGYDHVFEPKVLPTDRAIETFAELSARLGPELVVWRYDPIVETSLTPWESHLERFSRISEQLAGLTHRCVFSFVQLYQKTRRRMDQLAVTHEFDYRFFNYTPEQGRYSQHGTPYEIEEMQDRSLQLARIAGQAGIQMQTCCCDALIDEAHNIARSHCVDLDLVNLCRRGKAELKEKPTRQDCGCVESKDIGAYDTCPHGCGASYCYAVRDQRRAANARREHDPASEFLHWPFSDDPPPRKQELGQLRLDL